MKKKITVILAIALLFLTIPSRNVEAAVSKKQVGKAYAKIVQRYMEVYNLVKEDPYFDPAEYDGYSKVNPEFIAAANYYEGNRVMYRIMDFNQDGVPELFVGLKDAKSYGTIYGAYTFRGGKAAALMANDIGYRAGTCILRKRGIIEDRYSDSAFEGGVTFHKIGKNRRLTKVVTLKWDYAGKGVFKKSSKGKTTRISEKKLKQLQKHYGKPKKVIFYRADSRAVERIKEGSFSYSGQKKWNVQTGD